MEKSSFPVGHGKKFVFAQEKGSDVSMIPTSSFVNHLYINV